MTTASKGSPQTATALQALTHCFKQLQSCMPLPFPSNNPISKCPSCHSRAWIDNPHLQLPTYDLHRIAILDAATSAVPRPQGMLCVWRLLPARLSRAEGHRDAGGRLLHRGGPACRACLVITAAGRKLVRVVVLWA